MLWYEPFMPCKFHLFSSSSKFLGEKCTITPCKLHLFLSSPSKFLGEKSIIRYLRCGALRIYCLQKPRIYHRNHLGARFQICGQYFHQGSMKNRQTAFSIHSLPVGEGKLPTLSFSLK